MREAVFEIPVIVLIGLGLHEHCVIDSRRHRKPDVLLERQRRRLVRRVRRQRKALQVVREQMDMGVYDRSAKPARARRRQTC
jgi:hypothetical protein